MTPIIRAVFWMAGALASFLSLGIAGRELSPMLSPQEMAFYRNVLCLILLVPFIVRAGGWRTVATRRLPLHIARNSVHFCAQWSWFFGLGVLPMAEVFALEFTAPIWTAVLAVTFLGERLTTSRALAIALGFAGIMIILRPGLMIINPASLVVLAAAFGYGVSYVMTKRLVVTESPMTILFWMNVVQLPIGGMLSIGDFTIPDQSQWHWIAVLGIGGLTSHYCIARALNLADATVVVPLDFLRLPLVALVAWLVYNEALDPFVLFGAVFIVAANWINVKRG